MKTFKRSAFILFLLTLTVSCSNQYRTASTDDWGFVAASLEQVVGTSNSAEINQFKQLAEIPGANIYYSDSPGYGSPSSVASLGSFAFFDRPNLWVRNITEVRVFFVDALTAQGRQSALILSIKENGSSDFTTKAYVSTRISEVQGGEFSAVVGSNGRELLTLRTMDLDEDGELEGIIKLHVSEFNRQGLETYIGQFSTMVGYQK